MSWRRGLFSLWFVGTAIWMIGWTIVINMNCHLSPGGKLVCRVEPGSWLADVIERNIWSYYKLAMVGFSVPAAVLVVGAIVTWAMARRK